MEALVENAIKSLYQMIVLFNDETGLFRVLDRNPELMNLPVTDTFDEFCENLYINLHPEEREGFVRFTDGGYFSRELKSRAFTSYECRIRQNDGHYYWSEIFFCHATREDRPDGHEYLFLIQDIHERKVKERQAEAEQRGFLLELQDKYADLFEENMRDEQTGCYNRKGMRYYTDIVLEEARKTGNHLFVCVADLNGLKHLNDTYGHQAGDEAIAVVSGKLLSSAPKGSRIVRTGGDEFLLMATLPADSTEPEEMGQKLDEELETYNKEHANPYTIGASYGWVLLPAKEGMVDLDEYVVLADMRMYDMKNERDAYRRS